MCLGLIPPQNAENSALNKRHTALVAFKLFGGKFSNYAE